MNRAEKIKHFFLNISEGDSTLLDYSSVCIPISASGGIASSEIINGEDDTFWSPSMTVPPQSPQFPATSHEQRSAPSTPNNRSGTSPPEAAVEATPETTPVKVRL